MELITVIINTYNGEKYIKKCLDSIINQTYKNLEILVINDGSTDNSLNILNTYKDKRIKVITTENKGLSLSRNVGIDNALGKYLYFVDVDDFIEKDTIEYLYNLINKYKVKIATCNHENIYDYDFTINQEKENIITKSSKQMISEVLLGKGRVGTIWNKLFDISLFNNIRFENRIVNDVVVIYKLYLNANKIAYSNQKKYFYLKRNDSISIKRSKERQIDMYKACLERYDYLKKVWPNYIENEAGLLLMIFKLYYYDYKKIKDFYKAEKVKKKYNEIFSLKVLKCDLRTNDKIKIILFRISPKLSKLVTKIYVYLHHIKK